MKHILLLFSIQICCGEFGGNMESITNMLNFVNELLRNNSNNQIPYLAKIHALFCPDQSVCSVNDSQEKNRAINRLNSVLNSSYITTGIEQIKSAIGMCCLPCSCSESCQEHNYCCPTKYFVKSIPTEIPTKSDCIAATSQSYKVNSKVDNQYMSYFMITHCFLDTSNQTILSKCENPLSVNIYESTPVTSVLTGQTYWNEYCALCNNDTDNILPWNSTAHLREDIVYYASLQRALTYPQSLDSLLRILDTSSTIVYTPPFPMDHDQCLLDTSPNFHLTCERERNTNASEEHLLIIEACEKLYNPVYVNFRNIYRNIFCFLCLEEDMRNVPQVECKRQFDSKFPGGQMTALLKYKLNDDVDITAYNKEMRGKCPCDTIYDHYQDFCRPILCPPGEFLTACRCKQPINSLSGMPLLLKLKVFPEPGKHFPTTETQINKLHKALQKTIKTTIEQITVEIIATFQQENADTPYHLYVVIVRTKPGYDTKETMKPFLDYVEDQRQLKVISSKTTFLVTLTNTVLFWSEEIIGMDGNRAAGFRASEIEDNNHPLTITYTKPGIMETAIGSGYYQAFSPLLYCVQVQLEENEFSEKDGFITLNITTPLVSLFDYYRVSTTQARVCADQYLQQSNNFGNKLIFAFDPLGLVCMLSLMNFI